MRTHLKEFDWYLYGNSIDDLEHTLSTAREFVKARRTLLDNQYSKYQEEQPDVADDIMDDLYYYAYRDESYIWQFALWRMQAVFESLVKGQYLKNKETKGLRNILKELNKEYSNSVEKSEIDELSEWAALRNALSHAPPERHRTPYLEEEDVLEYKALLEKVLFRLERYSTR